MSIIQEQEKIHPAVVGNREFYIIAVDYLLIAADGEENL